MRLIEIIASLGPGGAETLVKDLSISFANRGHELMVLVVDEFSNETTEIDKISKLNLNGITVESLNRKPGKRSLTPFFNLKKKIKGFQPDLIHIHSTIAGLYCLPFLYSKIKFVQTVHNTYLPKSFFSEILSFPPIKKKISKIYCSRDSEIMLGKKLGKGTIIPNGIKVNSPKDVRLELIKKFNITKEDYVVLNVGRVSKQKNQLKQLEIIEELNERKYKGNLKLLICGAIKDNETFTELKNYQLGMKYPNCVQFIGIHNNIIDLMYSADVYISTSIHEGLPITALEAMSTGVPLLLSPIAEHKNVFQNEAQVAFPENNCVKEYSRKLECLISKSKKSEIILDRQTFIKKYDIENTVDDYLNVFHGRINN